MKDCNFCGQKCRDQYLLLFTKGPKFVCKVCYDLYCAAVEAL